jgi:SAM-dependent methyltransferase
VFSLVLTSTKVLIQTAITSPRLLFSSFASYRNRAFAKLWLAVGKDFADDVPPNFDAVLQASRGVILDVGPGGGHQLFRFSRPENITAIYGVEPGIDMHDSLRELAKKAGLGKKYTVVTCGAEPESLIPALEKPELLGKGQNVVDGVFDEVVCIRVLCGVPRLNEIVESLYKLLKPGGRFVVCEHILSDSQHGGNAGVRALQHVYMALGWSFLIGGCHLTRDTIAALMKAAAGDGGWADTKLDMKDEWSAVPHVVGYCVKKG